MVATIASAHLIVPGYNTNIDETLRASKYSTTRRQDNGHDGQSPARTERYAYLWLSRDCFQWAHRRHTRWGTWFAEGDCGSEKLIVGESVDKLKTRATRSGCQVELSGEYGRYPTAWLRGLSRLTIMEYVTKGRGRSRLVAVYWDNGGRGSGGRKLRAHQPQRTTVCCTQGVSGGNALSGQTRVLAQGHCAAGCPRSEHRTSSG